MPDRVTQAPAPPERACKRPPSATPRKRISLSLPMTAKTRQTVAPLADVAAERGLGSPHGRRSAAGNPRPIGVLVQRRLRRSRRNSSNRRRDTTYSGSAAISACGISGGSSGADRETNQIPPGSREANAPRGLGSHQTSGFRSDRWACWRERLQVTPATGAHVSPGRRASPAERVGFRPALTAASARGAAGTVPPISVVAWDSWRA
jgi:hypothetical protein